jgi:hypothetical protein
MKIAMYEHHSKPLLPRKLFWRRVLGHASLALLVLSASLGVGVAGYRLTEGLSLIDSILNASMILGGMGPVDAIKTPGGKLFASFYSLFSGIVFLGVVGIILAPIAHRMLHKLHLSEKNGH